MTLDECMKYIGEAARLGSKPGLSRIKELLERIGNPQKSLKFVHIVGTNGKGSVNTMISSCLTAGGFRVGSFVSPYIVTFNEQIRLDGVPIPDEDLCRVTEKIKEAADKMEDLPTEFEIVTAAGFEYFKECGCDIVVLEAGMGGALDSTNVIDVPILSVFTAISLDHKTLLGDTVEKIARTKAGILKKGTKAVFYGEETAAISVLAEECEKKNVPLVIPDRKKLNIKKSDVHGSLFDYKQYRDVKLSLIGMHQVYNAITAIEALEILADKGFAVNENALYGAFSRLCWPGRFEILEKKPLVIFDGAHNINGVTGLVENIKQFFPGKKIVMLMGVMADKDYAEMLDMLVPLCKYAYAVKPENPRALSAERLAEEIKKRGVDAKPTELSPADFNKIRQELACDDVLLLVGSLYMYREAVKALKCEEK